MFYFSFQNSKVIEIIRKVKTLSYSAVANPSICPVGLVNSTDQGFDVSKLVHTKWETLNKISQYRQ